MAQWMVRPDVSSLRVTDERSSDGRGTWYARV